MEQSKTKTKILTEQGIFQPTPEIGAAMQAFADQEKRKEATAFCKWLCDQSHELKITLIDNNWYWESDKDGDQPLAEEHLYDLYLQQTQNPR